MEFLPDALVEWNSSKLTELLMYSLMHLERRKNVIAPEKQIKIGIGIYMLRYFPDCSSTFGSGRC